MTLQEILADIKSDRVKKCVIDTDAFNEIDDQFAIAYSYLSKKLDVLAVYAAPFFNGNSKSYEDGMERSYHEIIRVLGCCDKGFTVPVLKGSRASIDQTGKAVDSEAADHLIKLAHETNEMIYVFGMAAITNVASALMKDPTIKDKICVIWLAASETHADHLDEFNLNQDYKAGQILLNSGVNLLLCPAWSVVWELKASLSHILDLQGHNSACDCLYDLGYGYYCGAGKPEGWYRCLWDIAAPAILDNPDCAEIEIITAPVMTDDRKYAFDSTRHKIMILKKIDRDKTYEKAWEVLKAGK
ncbi:MAG: nucleoside hydrolase [Clostridia bacterium]|nr:nucleoside hydrolase [Clostridia bacterium]